MILYGKKRVTRTAVGLISVRINRPSSGCMLSFRARRDNFDSAFDTNSGRRKGTRKILRY